MKFGCSAVPEEIFLVKKLGFDYVELPGKAVAAMSESDFYTLTTQLSRLDLPCMALNAYCPAEIRMAGPNFSRQAAAVYARTLARRAGILGVRCICVGSPQSRILPECYDRKLATDQLAAFLSDAVTCFDAVGAKIAFEALGVCYCNFFNYMEETLPLLERFPGGSLGLMVDFYNMERSNEGSLSLTPYLPHVLHVHISDDAGTPFKRNFLNPARFPVHRAHLRQLLEGGYDNTITLEVDLPIQAPEATASLQFLRYTCGS